MSNNLQILSSKSLSPATCWRGRIEHRVSGIVHRLLLAACGGSRARKKNKIMQNKANLKNTEMTVTACNITSYGNFLTFLRRKNKAKQSQNKANFGPKLALFYNEIIAFRYGFYTAQKLKFWFYQRIIYNNFERSFYCNLPLLDDV